MRRSSPHLFPSTLILVLRHAPWIQSVLVNQTIGAVRRPEWIKLRLPHRRLIMHDDGAPVSLTRALHPSCSTRTGQVDSAGT
jgi:hypothetical protein